MTRLAPLIALALLAATPCAAAPEPMGTAACAAVDDAALPPALAAWTRRTPVDAAVDPGALVGARLGLGEGADARLRPSGEVAFPAPPARSGASGTYGGLLALTIVQPGDYQVSLGSGAWIEVAERGRTVASVRHAPGPPCTTLKKTVVFPLKPGAYVLEVTGAPAPLLPVLVTRVG